MSTQQDDNVSIWAQRWAAGQTGWHLTDFNPVIKQFGEKWLSPSPTENDKKLKLMFPLCGKTLDMKHLTAQGYECYGIEGVESAITQYGAENNVEIKDITNTNNVDKFKTLQLGDDAIVYFGDFFDWPVRVPSDLVYDRVFDRGSLVAILPEKRKQYVDIINSMLPIGGKWLITSMAYKQEEKPGAPHSVSENDLEELLQYLKDNANQGTNIEYTIEVLQKDVVSPETIDDSYPWVRSRFLKINGGLMSQFTDYVFLVTKTIRDDAQ